MVLLKEEVYLRQPPSFEDFNLPNHVLKLKKASYVLSTSLCKEFFLMQNEFEIKMMENFKILSSITSKTRRQ
ncbi:hypothetical protein CR513_01821, partial [Mucuna pruriens]